MLSEMKWMRTGSVALMVVVLLSGVSLAKKPAPPDPEPEPDPPPVTYHLTLFDGMSYISVSAMNEAAEVVGTASTGDGYFAFLYTPEWGVIDLNTMVPEGFIGHLKNATDINNSGEIVGTLDIYGELLDSRAFKLTLPTEVDGVAVVQDLGKLHTDDRWLRSWTINDAGEVAGHGSDVNSERFAWYYHDLVGMQPVMEDYWGDLSVMTINNNGVILGQYYSYDSSQYIAFKVVPGETPQFFDGEGALSSVQDMNDSGSFIGHRGFQIEVKKNRTIYINRAFVHDGTTLIDIAGDDSIAYAINNHGDVVGESHSLGGPFVYLEGLQKAFCFETAVIGDPDDLLIWYSYPNYTPADINDSGQICGHIMNMYGDDFVGFVLTPISPEE